MPPPLRLVLLAALPLALAGVAAAQVCPGLVGQDALDCVTRDYRPARVLGESQSKDRMMDTVWRTSENGADGVAGAYTGRFVPFDGVPSSDPNQDVFNGGSGLNQEHVWPRAEGTGSGNAESDLHHLFPADVRANADRGNLPFGTIPDDAASTWYRGAERQSATPTEPDAWSQLAGGRFEPRAAVRGDVARALFYVRAVYAGQVDLAWFEGQRDALLAWHAEDPASDAERGRSDAVAGFQSGCAAGPCVNPFVADPTLADRAFDGRGVASEGDPGGGAAFAVRVGPSPTAGPLSVAVDLPASGEVVTEVFDALGRRVAVVREWQTAGVGRPLALGLGGAPAGVYVVRVTSGAETATRTVVVAR